MEGRMNLYFFKTRMFCDLCFKENRIPGQMETTGKVFFSNPPKYEHKCSTCGCKEKYLKQYPHINYEEINHLEW